MKKSLLKMALIGATLTHSYATDLIDSEDIKQQAILAHSQFDESILRNIFTYTIESSENDEEEFKNMYLVCKNWKNVLDAMHVKEKILGYYTIDLSKFTKKAALAQLDQDLAMIKNIRHLTILGATTELDFQEKLRGTHIFLSKVMGGPSLKSIKIHSVHYTLFSKDFIDSKNSLEECRLYKNIKNIKELDILCLHSSEVNVEKQFYTRIIPALTQLEKVAIGPFREKLLYFEAAKKHQSLKTFIFYHVDIITCSNFFPHVELYGIYTFNKILKNENLFQWIADPENPQNDNNREMMKLLNGE